jgi:hypothetical protein
MICPTCGAEYVPGFTRCADCSVDLVETSESCPEPKSGGNAEPLPLGEAPVCVYRATLRGRAPLAESLLRSAGIRFAVAGEHLQHLTMVDGYGLVQLYVSAADAADARAILADLDRQP